MTTLAVLKARIADELSRSDLTSQIATAVSSAIAFYQRRRFYFNEATASVTVSSGAEFYGSADAAFLGSLVKIDTARLAIGGVYYQLRQMAWSEIDTLASGPTVRGTPGFYCYYAQQVRLYPIPSASATLRLAYVARVAEPASDAASNVWTLPADAEELIRCRAKADLYENLLIGAADMSDAIRMRGREQEILAGLLRETGGKAASGTIVPNNF